MLDDDRARAGHWYCIRDQQSFTQRQDELFCKSCGCVYKMVDGIPIFFDSDQVADRTRETVPMLDELWEAVRINPCENTLQHFCLYLGCVHYPHGIDWKILFPVPKGGPVLELGCGIGEQTLELTRSTSCTISLAPHVTHALIAQARLRRGANGRWKLGVTQNLMCLPFADQQFEALVMEDVSAAGFHLHNGNIDACIAEWRRVLKPGSTIFLGLENGLIFRALFQLIRSISPNVGHPETLNRLVKSCVPGSNRHRRLTAWHTVRRMRRHGFVRTHIYSPFPDQKKMKIVLPLDDSQAIAYFLRNAVPRHAGLWRIALFILHILNMCKVFPYLLPYYFIAFKLNE